MTENSSIKGETERLARRNLLKLGALAAPLVLTFKSNSAWALSGGCKLLNGTKPIPGTFTVPVPPYNATTVIISQSVGDVVTSSTPLTSDEARFLIDNGNLSLSCYASITMGGGPGGASSSTSTSSSSGGSSSGGYGSSSSTSSGSSSSSSSGGKGKGD